MIYLLDSRFRGNDGETYHSSFDPQNAKKHCILVFSISRWQIERIIRKQNGMLFTEAGKEFIESIVLMPFQDCLLKLLSLLS